MSQLACNLHAIEAANRPRYHELANRFRSSIESRIELSDGYRYQLDYCSITPAELAEWINMERRCCPFLEFELDAVSNLTLRGSPDVKAIIQREFPHPVDYAEVVEEPCRYTNTSAKPATPNLKSL